MVIIFSLAFSYATFEYILIPHFTSNPAPLLFYKINSSFYGICEAFIFGITLPIILRTNKTYHHFFLQGLLLLCISDFAIRYRSVNLEGGPATWHAHMWDVSLALIFISILFKGHLLDKKKLVNSFISVRTLLAIAITVGIMLFMISLYFIGIEVISNALDFADILLIAYVIWLISNLISLNLSTQILDISRMLFKSKDQFILDKNLYENKFRFRIVNKLSHIYEIDDILKHYNALIGQANNLLSTLVKRNRLAAIGQTTALVAHDVRRPLAGMKAILNILPEIKDDPEKLDKVAQDVDASINQANSILSEILEFSQMDMVLEFEKLDPQNIIISAITNSFRSKDDIDVKVEYDLKHHNYLWADADKIIRVLTNIMVNAIEAAKEKFKLVIQTKDVDGMLKLTIANNGPKIPGEVMEKMFEPFFTKGKKNGTGLGLSICSKIVEAHNGKIEVSSVHELTKFIIYLPSKPGALLINPTALITHSNQAQQFKGNAGQKTVLLLNDDETMLLTFRMFLKSTEVEILEATNVQKALKYFEEDKIDVIISDINLGPDEPDGYEFLNIVRAKNKDLPFYITSGYSAGDEEPRARANGATGYLQQPLEKEMLLRIICVASDKH
ncbi:MAG: hybrid sensor histidine kinase/response regulator [Candidatus Margulisbacteria bacterium]|nr:hybrid sensor histidine kinase/response regulator [Candidatus Margulisiibacteriota bacterium]